MKMTNGTKPPRSKHCAVCVDNCAIIFGGASWSDQPVSTRVIWSYNLYTEEWREYAIQETRDVPVSFIHALAVAIDGTTYTFGGLNTKGKYLNDLWALERTKRGRFTWSYIKSQCKEQSPSPRAWHSGWEYEGKLWIFGGLGPSPEGYLNCNGDIAGYLASGRNNQLLCYDPNTQKWSNPHCFGDVPSPRSGHASAIIKNNAWLCRGCDNRQYFDDMFQLTMHSLAWTRIQTVKPQPQACNLCTLTALTEYQLVLHGGHGREVEIDNTWIMDLQSHSWRLYRSGKDHSHCCHTGSSGLNSSAIIFGGCGSSNMHDVFYVALEPKLLQQMAMQIIYTHKDELPWDFLPDKLISLLGMYGLTYSLYRWLG